MGKITFILGGARSGKSSFALGLAKKCKKKAAFVATCQPLDKEMKQRIALHKKMRPKHWQTFEAAKDIIPVLKKIDSSFGCVVIDCLTLLVSNLLLAKHTPKKIEDRIKEMIRCLKKNKSRTIIVSNEVGLGIVPENKLARDFRDIAGRVNQVVAGVSDAVFFMVAGIPTKIKGGRRG